MWELPLTESPAGSRNPVLQVQFILHEQQIYCGGLLFLVSPLDDAVIEASSSHPEGLAANTCNNRFIVRSCENKEVIGSWNGRIKYT